MCMCMCSAIKCMNAGVYTHTQDLLMLDAPSGSPLPVLLDCPTPCLHPCMLPLFLHTFSHFFAALDCAQAVEAETGRAFPAHGKIVVKFGGRTAEALLELPAPSTRDGAAELPAVVWLTVGLLATDNFALQVYTMFLVFKSTLTQLFKFIMCCY